MRQSNLTKHLLYHYFVGFISPSSPYNKSTNSLHDNVGGPVAPCSCNQEYVKLSNKGSMYTAQSYYEDSKSPTQVQSEVEITVTSLLQDKEQNVLFEQPEASVDPLCRMDEAEPRLQLPDPPTRGEDVPRHEG